MIEYSNAALHYEVILSIQGKRILLCVLQIMDKIIFQNRTMTSRNAEHEINESSPVYIIPPILKSHTRKNLTDFNSPSYFSAVNYSLNQLEFFHSFSYHALLEYYL